MQVNIMTIEIMNSNVNTKTMNDVDYDYHSYHSVDANKD